MTDLINHPAHYTARKVEAIEVTEDLNFCLGNAVKYILRCDYKGKPIEDLDKAVWYVQREIDRRLLEAGEPARPKPDVEEAAKRLALVGRALVSVGGILPRYGLGPKVKELLERVAESLAEIRGLLE